MFKETEKVIPDFIINDVEFFCQKKKKILYYKNTMSPIHNICIHNIMILTLLKIYGKLVQFFINFYLDK